MYLLLFDTLLQYLNFNVSKFIVKQKPHFGASSVLKLVYFLVFQCYKVAEMDREIVIWCLLEMCSAKRREIERGCEIAEEVVSEGLWGTPDTELQEIVRLRDIFPLLTDPV